jgi:hypothetical protein
MVYLWMMMRDDFGEDIVSVPIPNPSANCGARCIACAVGVPCTERNTQGVGVPGRHASGLDERRERMGRCHCARDTSSRSVASVGTVGFHVCCATCDRWPSPRRAFAPEAWAGCGDVPCNEARQRYGPPPLRGFRDATIVA